MVGASHETLECEQDLGRSHQMLENLCDWWLPFFYGGGKFDIHWYSHVHWSSNNFLHSENIAEIHDAPRFFSLIFSNLKKDAQVSNFIPFYIYNYI